MHAFSLGSLAAWRHPSPTPAAARVLLIHGISEHSGRHLTTVAALNAASIEVVRFDLRGSGKSGGARQYVKSFSEYTQDVATVFNWIESELESLPLFVMGHSLGGAIAVHFAAEYGRLFNGLILSAPAFQTGGVSPLTVLMGRVLARFIPGFRIYSKDSSALSRDEEVVEAYVNDPLATRYNTLAQGKAVLDALAQMPEMCKKISNPTAIFHGTSDRVILPAGSFELVQSLASAQKELHYLPSVYHEPHLDWDSEKYFTLLVQWLRRQIANRD